MKLFLSLRLNIEITTPPSARQPAAVLPQEVLLASGAAMAFSLNVIVPYWTQNREAIMAGGMVIYKYGADQLDAVFDALSLSSRTIGELGLASIAPDGSTWEDYLGRPVTPKAIELSKIERPLGGASRKPGGCDDDEFRRLDKRKDQACYSESYSCNPQQTKEVIEHNERKALACVAARVEIMDRCFDGGDKAHKDEAKDRLKPARYCRSLIDAGTFK
jgi:hypothetical protein